MSSYYSYIHTITHFYFLLLLVDSIICFRCGDPSGRSHLVADNHRTAPYGLYGVMKGLTFKR